MHWQWWTLGLSLCSLGHGLVEQLVLTGDANKVHAQSLYDLFGGTFILPFEGANGGNVTISGLHMVAGHKPSLAAMDTGMVARAPTYTVDSHHCAIPPDNLDRLLTKSQQEFIAGPFCQFLVSVTPYFWGAVGLTISNLACGGTFQYVCQGIITFSGIAGAGYIGPGLQQNCASVLMKLREECPQVGGQEKVSISGGSSFFIEQIATQETGADCQPKSGKGGEDCKTYTCTGQCNPGRAKPTHVS